MAIPEQSCGIAHFRPPWLKKLANTKCFVVIFSIAGALEVMASTYGIASLSTMEKRFKIPTRTVGMMKTGNEFSAILLCLAVAYFGGRGNRPRWLAWGTIISASASFLLALLHLVYGPSRQALALTEEHFDAANFNATLNTHEDLPTLCQENRTTGFCNEDDFISGEYSLIPPLFMFVSECLFGIGYTMNTMLGQTYMDDHTKKKNTPFMLGVVLSMNMVGPALGYFFASFCLRLYIDLSVTPIITREDPRWLGAWWLGWLMFGTMKLIVAALEAFFPKELPRTKKNLKSGQDPSGDLISPTYDADQEQRLVEQEPPPTATPESGLTAAKKKGDSDNDSFISSVARLFKNKILMCNIVANNMLFWGGYGYWLFMVKYTETQYHTSASKASMVSGMTLVVGTIIGFISSGLLMRKLKPSTKFVLGWNIFIGLINVCASTTYIFLECEASGVYGLDYTTGEFNSINECNGACSCENIKYQPVCFTERNITFFSPCHVGCKDNYKEANETNMYFTNCSCIPDVWQSNRSSSGAGGHIPATPLSYLDGGSFKVANGPCPVDCSYMMYIFVAIVFFVQVLLSSGRVANIIINFRCVAPKDKTLAQGVSMMIVSLFALLPAPVTFGAIIDSTCLVWDSTCGSKGNCWLYNKESFRLYFNLTAGGALAISTLLDVKLYFLAKDINLYEEEAESKPVNRMPTRKENILLKDEN